MWAKPSDDERLLAGADVASLRSGREANGEAERHEEDALVAHGVADDAAHDDGRWW